MKNFIHVKEKAYSKKSCKNLIKWFEENINISKPGNFGKNLKLNNLEIPCVINNLNDFWGLGTTIVEVIEEYKKEYMLFDNNIEKWNLNKNFQLCKFEPGNFYDYIHCENDGNKNNLDRVFAWMVYLNDIKEGGETEFIYQNFKTKPKQGNFYIWPAGITHMHKGVVAPKENKYFISGWINYI